MTKQEVIRLRLADIKFIIKNTNNYIFDKTFNLTAQYAVDKYRQLVKDLNFNCSIGGIMEK